MTTSRIDDKARPRPSAPAYFPALDGIRALAFLMVFATHYLQMPWGWTGVNIFFVLSGFLITGILFDTRNHPHHVYNFYLRRTLRIFPLYYGIMLLLVLLYPIFLWDWGWRWLIWPTYLGNLARAFTPHIAASSMVEFAQVQSRTFPKVQLAFGHFWSLCVEEQFYLLWPCVVFWIKDRRRLIQLCLFGLIALPLLRIAATHLLPQTTLDAAVLITATPLPFDALLIGGLIALLRRGPSADKILPASRIVFTSLTALALLWLTTHPAARHIGEPYPYPAGTFTWGLSLIDILSACLIVMAIERGSLTYRLFNLRPLRWLGRISYGAYVFHDIFHPQFIRLAQLHTVHWKLATAALAFASTLILAATSFRWFETPFIRLKDRWTRTSTIPREQAEHQAPELMPNVA